MSMRSPSPANGPVVPIRAQQMSTRPKRSTTALAARSQDDWSYGSAATDMTGAPATAATSAVTSSRSAAVTIPVS